MIRALKAWGPAAIWAAVLFLLSELPGLPKGSSLPLDDKVAHVLLYGVLGALLAWGRRMVREPAPHWILLVVGWTYGAMDEWHQGYVPGRTPDTADFLADVLGVVVGYTIFLFIARRFAKGASAPPSQPDREPLNADYP